MIALIFVLFVMYTLACIADGPDVKPRWKSWLGNKFLRLSQRYIRFNPCFGPPVCSHIRDARASVDAYRKAYALLRDQVERMVATDPGGLAVIRSKVSISEQELSHMYIQSRYYGGTFFEDEKNKAILLAKDLCKKNITNMLLRNLTFDVQEDHQTMGINVFASLVINRHYNEIDV